MAEKEFIERGALLETIGEMYDFADPRFKRGRDIRREMMVVRKITENQPTADVQEVRHGEWLEDDYGYCHCSNCRYEHDSPECITPYCPECGTKMDKE